MEQRRGALVSSRADAWLVGGAALLLWSIIELLRLTGGRIALPAMGGAVAWCFLALTAAHFGVSYHLAYAGRTGATRRHPWALMILPAVAVVVVVVAWAAPTAPASIDLFRLLVSAVLALTMWHYVKQAYGIARLELALHAISPSRVQARVLRYSLYPLWALSVAELFTRGTGGSMFGYRVGLDLLPTWIAPSLRVLAAVAMIVFAVMIVRMGTAIGRRVPVAVWAPHLAGFVWIGLGSSYRSTALVLAGAHALQYLACAHRAEWNWALSRNQPQPVLWLVAVLGAATAAGLFLTNWMAPVLAAVPGSRSVATLSAGLFVLLNLHHYAIDAVMWRSGGAHATRIVHPERDRPTELQVTGPQLTGPQLTGPQMGLAGAR